MSAVMIRSVANFRSGADIWGSRLITGNRRVVFSLSGRIELDDVAELQRLLSLEAAGQGVEFIASDVNIKHLLTNLRRELKRSHMKGKQDGGGNHWTEVSRSFSWRGADGETRNRRNEAISNGSGQADSDPERR